mmetsp:Transcript_16623/g.38913  ORF Transcript_16623/g.38913 Transcript_16623/m.38913 type:complete len:238 (+) Transcript_16623:155-868(+)
MSFWICCHLHLSSSLELHLRRELFACPLCPCLALCGGPQLHEGCEVGAGHWLLTLVRWPVPATVRGGRVDFNTPHLCNRLLLDCEGMHRPVLCGSIQIPVPIEAIHMKFRFRIAPVSIPDAFEANREAAAFRAIGVVGAAIDLNTVAVRGAQDELITPLPGEPSKILMRLFGFSKQDNLHGIIEPLTLKGSDSPPTTRASVCIDMTYWLVRHEIGHCIESDDAILRKLFDFLTLRMR